MKTLSILLFSIIFISFQASASCKDDNNAIVEQVNKYHSIKLANGQQLGIGTISNQAKSVRNTFGTTCQGSYTDFQYGEQGGLYWCEGNWTRTITTVPYSITNCKP